MHAWVGVCVCVSEWTQQRTTFKSPFSPSNMWVPGIDLRSTMLFFLAYKAISSAQWRFLKNSGLDWRPATFNPFLRSDCFDANS